MTCKLWCRIFTSSPFFKKNVNYAFKTEEILLHVQRDGGKSLFIPLLPSVIINTILIQLNSTYSCSHLHIHPVCAIRRQNNAI